MKRRQAIGVLGGVAAGPILVPSGAFAELLAWSERVRKSSRSPDAPSRLTPPRTRVMAALAEVIIPETDTPGASQAGVTEFVAALVDGWLDDDDRDLFLAGLDTVDPAARERFGADFADCTAAQQSEYVGELDAQVTRQREDPGASASSHFFHHVKRFTITAYFTSEVGLAAIGHRTSYRTFEGCAPLTPAEGGPLPRPAGKRLPDSPVGANTPLGGP
ncbi:MAG: gluconate 2-dehydrogenase subunit 3 family protein [Gemmatimonadota bacterium]|nr:gluconate 2-dehydrogenase subunit 3 family protein [Gemmatimonadota bacterium]